EGSAAFHLDHKLPSREIERRRKHLMTIQRQISKRRKKALIGREFDLLLEGPSQETDLLLEGRTEMHAPEIDGKVLINDLGGRENVRAGEFYRCQITEAQDYDLVARIV
ncbi:MAG: 30S ribosomal protein S12 methylthiotransferase RimO, partial [Chlamydiota bacterium]